MHLSATFDVVETGIKRAVGVLLPLPFSDEQLEYAKISIAGLLGCLKEGPVVGLPTNIRRKVWVHCYVFSYVFVSPPFVSFMFV